MTNDSHLIANTFYELQLFCKDVSLLLSSGEKIFKRNEWVSAQPKKACLYSGSTRLGRWDFWLPLRFFRYYKNPSFPTFLAYVAVIIELPPGREIDDSMAYLTSGGLNYSEKNGWGKGPTSSSTRICRWHINAEGSEYCGTPQWFQRPFKWTDRVNPQKWNNLIRKVDSAVTLGLPLHEISSGEQLESRVINPILESIENYQGIN